MATLRTPDEPTAFLAAVFFDVDFLEAAFFLDAAFFFDAFFAGDFFFAAAFLDAVFLEAVFFDAFFFAVTFGLAAFFVAAGCLSSEDSPTRSARCTESSFARQCRCRPWS